MAKETKIAIAVGEEERELLEKAISAHIAVFVKMHTACMKQKALEAAKELQKKISVMEKLLDAVLGRNGE